MKFQVTYIQKNQQITEFCRTLSFAKKRARQTGGTWRKCECRANLPAGIQVHPENAAPQAPISSMAQVPAGPATSSPDAQ